MLSPTTSITGSAFASSGNADNTIRTRIDFMRTDTATTAGDNNTLSLRIQNLTKTVQAGPQPLTILQAVNIEIKSGETVAIVGASGSGKSTLLGIMAGLDLPSSGSVQLLGHELSALDED